MMQAAETEKEIAEENRRYFESRLFIPREENSSDDAPEAERF